MRDRQSLDAWSEKRKAQSNVLNQRKTKTNSNTRRLFFAFPKEMAARAAEFPLVFTKFYPALKDDGKVKAYLASERRLPYSMGLYRHYPELDRQQ